MTGQVAWLLGSHLYLIALPWLVLQLTGDVVAMGTTIILSGVPRIALMLMGGAVSGHGACQRTGRGGFVPFNVPFGA